MVFSINSNSEISNIWARGQSNIETKLSTVDAIKKSNDNYYIVNKNMKGVKLKITAESEDYINVGCIRYNRNVNNYESNSKIIVNGPIITGYLMKDIMNEACYGFEMKEKPKNEKIIFGTGITMTKIAYSYLIYNNGAIPNNQNEQLIPLGTLSNNLLSTELEQQKICFTFPDPNKYPQFSKISEIVFTYQLVEESLIDNGLNLYEPQINGVFYPRLVKQNSKNVYIGHTNNFKKMHLNLMTLNGFPKMNVIEYSNYPFCSLDDLYTAKKPKNINRFSSYTYMPNRDIEYSLLNYLLLNVKKEKK
jgi:hypothetical protein